MNIAYNMDCLKAMSEMPDKYYDLAVVDPPYGNALTDEVWGVTYWNRFGQRFDRYKQDVERRGGQWATKYGKKIIDWDIAPGKEYFKQLFRISRNQVIWGGNYFNLPPTRCFLVWRKTNVPQDFTMAMVEYAWTSFNGNAKCFEFSSAGLPGRFHPTQKPVELYEWIYGMFAKAGYKILDTHLGSGSSRIAAYNMKLDFTGYEIDETYFKLQEERFAKHTMQTTLF